VEDHLELIEAIERGDPSEAASVVAGHFSGGATLMSTYVSGPARPRGSVPHGRRAATAPANPARRQL
jgi:hypothetical protein